MRTSHPDSGQPRAARIGELEILLNERQVAEILGVSLSTVRRWRLFGTGPLYLKIGAPVRYQPEAITALLNSQPTGGGQKARG